jgi:hypothetical protein
MFLSNDWNSIEIMMNMFCKLRYVSTQAIIECNKSPMEESFTSRSHQEEEVDLSGPIYDDTKGIIDK